MVPAVRVAVETLVLEFWLCNHLGSAGMGGCGVAIGSVGLAVCAACLLESLDKSSTPKKGNALPESSGDWFWSGGLAGSSP